MTASQKPKLSTDAGELIATFINDFKAHREARLSAEAADRAQARRTPFFDLAQGAERLKGIGLICGYLGLLFFAYLCWVFVIPLLGPINPNAHIDPISWLIIGSLGFLGCLIIGFLIFYKLDIDLRWVFFGLCIGYFFLR